MGQMKALLPLDDGTTTLLEKMVDTMGYACRDVIVVLGHEADRLRAAVPATARTVENLDYDRGMLSSLQTGLAAAGQADFVLFTPVDLPSLQMSTVQAVAQHCVPAASVVFPRWGGHRGHPVACGRPAVAALRNAPASSNARDVLEHFAQTSVYVEVDDPGIRMDIDDPASYHEYLRSAAR